ncbi:MAG: hypothetical protein ACR2I9_02125 [Candidatus Nanopelagicaceae bacterium]|jgi:hypothetical protein
MRSNSDSNFFTRFNRKLALAITSSVGTMTCAYLFAAIALISLPKAIASHDVLVIISWIAQTFLQLVLLSIIMVGQQIGNEQVNKQIAETHSAALAEFELAKSQVEELKKISAEVHELLRDIQKRIN